MIKQLMYINAYFLMAICLTIGVMCFIDFSFQPIEILIKGAIDNRFSFLRFVIGLEVIIILHNLYCNDKT